VPEVRVMNLRGLKQRLDHLAGAAATDENRPPLIRLRLAGAFPRVCRCGPALITVVSPEERRPELERQRAESERITGQPARNTLDEALSEEVRFSGDLAGAARALHKVLNMNSEERARMLAELDAKRAIQV
jgi:hypothetical protein